MTLSLSIQKALLDGRELVRCACSSGTTEKFILETPGGVAHSFSPHSHPTNSGPPFLRQEMLTFGMSKRCIFSCTED